MFEEVGEIAKKVGKGLAKNPVVWKAALISIIIVVLFAMVVSLFDFELDSMASAGSAQAAKAIKDGTRFENGEIVIDEDLYDKIRELLREFGLEPNDYYLGEDYNYLEKLVMATIVTNYVDTSIRDTSSGGGSPYTAGEVIGMSESEIWIAATNGVLNGKPADKIPSNAAAILAAVQSNLITITVPVRVWANPNDRNNQETIETTMTRSVNKAVAPVFESFFTDIFNETYLVIDLNNTGSWRGVDGALGYRSMHSYGAAFDINYATTYQGKRTNGYWQWADSRPAYSKQEWEAITDYHAKYETIYKDSPVAEIAKKYNITWGGNWNNFDTMHFSAFGEGGGTPVDTGGAYSATAPSGMVGAVKVYRRGSDGSSPRRLIYKDVAGFEAMFNAGDSQNIINYFTIDSNMNIVVAKYNKTTTTENNGTPVVEYRLEKVTLPYMNKISQYAMPFEFLCILLIRTNNPDYVAAVADLAIRQTSIDFTIMDSQYVNRTETEHSYWIETTVIRDGVDVSPNPRDIQYKSHKTVIEEINNITAEITHVKTWIYTRDVEYELKASQTEELVGSMTIAAPTNPPDPDNPGNPDYADPPPEVTTRTETEPIYEVLDDGTVVKTGDRTIYITTTKRTHDIKDEIEEYVKRATWSAKGPADEKIEPDLFLGLWSNETGEYIEGAKWVKLSDGGKIVEYYVPHLSRNNAPETTIRAEVDMFFYQLTLTEATQSYENLMRYILYVYTGIDYGVTEEDMNALLFLFSPRGFSGVRGGNISLTTPLLSREDFIKALQDYSPRATNKASYDANFMNRAGDIYDWGLKYTINPELVITMALKESGFKVSGNNQNYWGWGTPNGKGLFYIATFEEGVQKLAGTFETYNPGGRLASMIEERAALRQAEDCNPNGYGPPGTLKGMLSVYSDLCGSNKKHREGNWGDGGNIYLKIIYGSEFQAKCGTPHPIGVAEYTEQERADYTAYLYEKQLEYWNMIFGAYGTLGGMSGELLEVADQCHEHMEKNNYTYSLSTSQLPSSWEATWTAPYTCCATFVSWVLYEAGYTNQGNYPIHSASGLSNWCGGQGWQKITSYSELEPGDVVFMTSNSSKGGIGHTQLYAGNGQWFNAGSTDAIRRASPYTSDASGRFLHAYRPK